MPGAPSLIQQQTPKRKEIYRYEAPFTLYSMSWNQRPDKKFRLALGSFIEEYNNKVKNWNFFPFIFCFS